MRIIRVNNRYFVPETDRDYGRVALKVLNEDRRTGQFSNDNEREFVSKVCDSEDDDLAWAVLKRRHDVSVIAPEVI